MKRVAFLFGLAFITCGSGLELAAQQVGSQPVPFQPSYSVPTEPSPSMPGPMNSGQMNSGQFNSGQYNMDAQNNSAAQCAQPQYQGGSGHCGCPSCTQQPSECWTIFYRNTRWPSPFKLQDIDSVTSYFAVQRENGWKMHNTVGHVLFDSQTNCLTEAGKNHIRSILSDNPIDRRVVFVLQGQNQQQTSQRIESVQLAISALQPTGELPAIYVTDRDAPGSSGAYQTAVTRAMMTSLPAPRLPSFNATQGIQ